MLIARNFIFFVFLFVISFLLFFGFLWINARFEDLSEQMSTLKALQIKYNLEYRQDIAIGKDV